MHIAFYHAPILTLGPGKRVGLWVQGCSKHCFNCMSPAYQGRDKELGVWFDTQNLCTEIKRLYHKNKCNGVTISGGEPFEQGEELYQLLKFLHTVGINDIIVYSGWLEQTIILQFPWVRDLVTCLVDGPYLEDQPTDLACKGSANQRCILYRDDEKYLDWRNETKGRIQVISEKKQIHLVGIPRAGDASRLIDPGG